MEQLQQTDGFSNGRLLWGGRKFYAGALFAVLAMTFAAGYSGRAISERWWQNADRTAENLSRADEVAALLARAQSLRGQAPPGQDAPIFASTAATGESFAMATGSIDSDVEGLYLLDFITGDLQCVVLNFRTGQFNAVFRANVQADLGVDPAKRPKYLMTTGMINFPRGASAARPGNSVVYVLDTTTGNFAAYAIPWRRELAATGRPQAAALMLMDVGKARTAALRE